MAAKERSLAIVGPERVTAPPGQGNTASLSVPLAGQTAPASDQLGDTVSHAPPPPFQV